MWIALSIRLIAVYSLKVPSGQIGSAWEWYHWKALLKDINRFMFLIFYFWSWIFDKSSKFWAASCKNDSSLLLVRITVCIESWVWWKNPPKCSSILVWIAEWWDSLLTSRNPKTNWCLSRVYGVRFGEKDRGLSICKPWTEQAGGWIPFCMKRLRTLNSYQYSRSKIKN